MPSRPLLRRFAVATAFVVLSSALLAEPLSRRTEIDFFRDVPSRNLKGLAARSDGRLVAGPTLTDLSGEAPADLLWSLENAGDANKWFVGSGPDGRIFELTIDAGKSTFASREYAKLEDPHVFALARLRDGSLLAGTSPRGGLVLLRDGKQVARVALPVDSIFDLLLPTERNGEVLVATGNPARIYSINIAQFEKGGVAADKITDPKALAERGIRLFAEVRDRNIRRLARLSDGRIVAGSAPKGNLYTFEQNSAAAPTDPLFSAIILQENREAEVTDLLPTNDGGLYATLTFSAGTGDSRITPGKTNRDTPDPLAALSSPVDRFTGRSTVVWFPPNGFPETITSRGNTAFYRIARHGDLLLLAGGEQGEIVGYDTAQRLSLTFAGSASSQLNGMAPFGRDAGRFLLMRNNAPGFSLLDFSARATREAETRRIDLGVPSLLGAVRFNRLRELSEKDVAVELRASNGSDEVEGWSSWNALEANDGGWTGDEQRGRFIKLRLKLPPKSPSEAQVDKAYLFSLPQNRRPQLQDFRILSTNFGIVPSPDPMPATVVSLSQLLQSPKDDETKPKGSFMGSQVVPSPGTQAVLWTVNDPDGDNVVFTFSLRRDGDDDWTDVAVKSRDSFAQFDTSHLRDGVYFTRLTATETDPRPENDRLVTVFDTDDLMIDRTPPEIAKASAKRNGSRLVVTVRGRDALSIVQGFEAILNNGVRAETEQPADGIRDSREETFIIEFPLDRATNATSVEVVLYDQTGNSSAQRLKFE